MTIYVKKQLVDSIESISFDQQKQIEEFYKYPGACVSELINCWFDYMPRKIVGLLENKIISFEEAKLLMEFHDTISDISRKLDYTVKSEDVFKNDSNWAELREKANEIYSKLKGLGSLKD